MTKFRPLHKTLGIFRVDTNIQNYFKFNEFSHDIEYSRTPLWDESKKGGESLTDDDFIMIKNYLTNIHNHEPSKTIICESCFILGIENRYHPVKAYLDREKWDGVNRLDEWLIKSVNCEDNVYTRMAGRKILIAAVNRVYNPGCKFDHMMIFEGAQGIGKSTLVEELAGDFYLDTSLDNRDKDLVDIMRRGFIIEIGELSGMNKKEIEWLKSFLVRKTDVIRLPYAMKAKQFPRSCIFIGTYNPSGNNMYFRDDTGNRRFWPIECNKIDIGYVKENKHQIWAEAVEMYKAKEQYYITNPQAVEIMLGLHAERELESPTQTKIRKWLQDHGGKEVSMETLIESALGIKTDGQTPKDLLSISTTIGIIMRKLKWIKGKGMDRDKYFAPEGFEYLQKERSQQIEWDE